MTLMLLKPSISTHCLAILFKVCSQSQGKQLSLLPVTLPLSTSTEPTGKPRGEARAREADMEEGTPCVSTVPGQKRPRRPSPLVSRVLLDKNP